MTDITHITSNLETLVNNLTDILIIIVAIGIISMSAVEFLKAVFFVRRKYHKVMFEKWLNISIPPNVADENKRLYQELCYLTTGNDFDIAEWLDQSTDEIFPQLHSVSQIVIESPNEFSALFKFLAKPNSETPFNHPEHINSRSEELLHLQNLSHLASRRIEILRIRLELTWTRINQLLALSICLVISFFTNDINFSSVLIGLLSGLVSPVSKDILSNLTSIQLRRL